MIRRLLLALLAAAIGVLAAALLRAERRLSRAGQPTRGGGRCVARTRAGEPCSRAAEPGSERCWQHRRR